MSTLTTDDRHNNQYIDTDMATDSDVRYNFRLTDIDMATNIYDICDAKMLMTVIALSLQTQHVIGTF